MANRPLYNGSARASVDNNAVPAALNQFTMRASVGALGAGVDTLANATFEAEAGTPITINYRVDKLGAGPNLGTPTQGFIRIFDDDDSNDARSGAVFDSGDIIGGGALPISGTVTFTPAEAGTFRIQVEMQKDNGDFGATSDDWRVLSDGTFQRGTLANPVRAIHQDKGRLRAGVRVTAIDVTKQDGSAAPSKFAFTMNAGGTAAEEGVRVTTTLSHDGNKTTSTEVYRSSARRNGTSTIDSFDATARLSATQHRITRTITQLAYPNVGVNQPYDSVITIENNSALHANNTRQYDALGGQAASGVWTYFITATAPLTLVDYRTVAKTNSYNVDAGGSIENIWCQAAGAYAEDGAKIPTGSETVDYVATDENMTVKTGRVLNSRGEPLRGIFMLTDVTHEGTNVSRDSWGMNVTGFATLANGWQDAAHTVIVSTPPGGVHRVKSEAYFPSGTLATPATRQFYAIRTEAGAPASTSTGKNWIAPASFSHTLVEMKQVVKGGVSHAFIVRVFDKAGPRDADSIPTVIVRKNGGEAVFATPVLTKRAGTTGIYDGSFAPTAKSVGDASDTYVIEVTATVVSFTRVYGDAIEVVAYDPATHAHDADGSVESDRFDPIGLFK